MPVNARSQPRAKRLKGLFRDSKWLCNCKPRRPAKSCRVKRGKNKGDSYYSCHEGFPGTCKLFLWAHEAAARENRVILLKQRNKEEESDSASSPGASCTPSRSPSPTAYDHELPSHHTANTILHNSLSVNSYKLEQHREEPALPNIKIEDTVASDPYRALSMPSARPLPESRGGNFNSPVTPSRHARIVLGGTPPSKRKHTELEGVGYFQEYDSDGHYRPRFVELMPRATRPDGVHEPPEEDCKILMSPASRLRQQGRDPNASPASLMPSFEAPGSRRFKGMDLERPTPPNFGPSTEAAERQDDAERADSSSTPFLRAPDTELSKDLLAALRYFKIELNDDASEAIKAISSRYDRQIRGLQNARNVLRTSLAVRDEELERKSIEVRRLKEQLAVLQGI